VTRLGRYKEIQRALIEYSYSSSDNQKITVSVSFELKEKYPDTIEDFDKKATKRPEMGRVRIEDTKKAMDGDEACRHFLAYYDKDRSGQSKEKKSEEQEPQVGEPGPKPDDGKFTQEYEEIYINAVSDPDYTDEGLKLLSVTWALRRSTGGRIRVHGVIESIKTDPMHLYTKVNFTCINEKCRRFNIPNPCILDTPVYSLRTDMPIAFKEGVKKYHEWLKCPSCRVNRIVEPDNKVWAAAKTIKIRRLDDNATSKTKLSGTTAMTALRIETLTVLLFHKHTLSLGFGEEIEIVGDMYMLDISSKAARFGSRGTNTSNRAVETGNITIAQPVLYATRVKYTKRERAVELTKEEIEEFEKIGKEKSVEDIINNELLPLASPEIYGNEDAKLGMILVAIGPGPNSASVDNYCSDRSWMNAALVGDAGAGKSTIAIDAAALKPGSQTVSGIHSTGKGIVGTVAVGPDGTPYLHAGPIKLASDAICVIDEYGRMTTEDQSQVYNIATVGYADFNKWNVNVRIHSRASLVITANPRGDKWENPDAPSLDELPMKGAFLDRMDIIFVFRKPRTKEEIQQFAENKLRIGKDKKTDRNFTKLKKYIYYICDKQYDKFAAIKVDNDVADRLSEFWTQLMIENPVFISNRSNESLYRIVKAIARATHRTVVDSEVADYAIKFVGNMYRRYGAQISPPKDYRNISCVEICKVVKKYSEQELWAQQHGGLEIGDIIFNEAAEQACQNNPDVRQHLGTNFSGRLNRPAGHLREDFRNPDGIPYEGGKVKDVSTSIHTELKLRWIPDSTEDSSSTKGMTSATVRQGV
jgi:MoxR-like ATPase